MYQPGVAVVKTPSVVSARAVEPKADVRVGSNSVLAVIGRTADDPSKRDMKAYILVDCFVPEANSCTAASNVLIRSPRRCAPAAAQSAEMAGFLSQVTSMFPSAR